MPPSGISTTSSDASSSGDSAKSLSSPSWWIAGSVAAGVGLGLGHSEEVSIGLNVSSEKKRCR